MDSLLTAVYFILVLGLLITVHESGHFLVARWRGVKVLRFSIGFGRPLWRYQAAETEYVIAAIPLGGYVKMLDEREGPVAEAELSRAFNRQPLDTRIAVVAAGPLFNLLFAVLAYWLMFMHGTSGLIPVVGEVEAESPAAIAGFRAGDQIIAVNGEQTLTWERVIQLMISRLIDEEAIQLEIKDEEQRLRYLQLEQLFSSIDDIARGNFFTRTGITPKRPVLPPIIGEVIDGGAAQQGGLLPGDRIVSAEGQAIETWQQWVKIIRAHPGQQLAVQLQRDAREMELMLIPERIKDKDGMIGRIGASVYIPNNFGNELYAIEKYNLMPAMQHAFAKTWEISRLTLQMIWKMLMLEVSVENLSGPISIAQFAGHSAEAGLSRFLEFLAIVSVSLGVLNLLPIPLLDGGHLMYYVIEIFMGKPVPESVQAVGQQIGIVMLMMLMGIAIVNDITRLFG